jgi:hypothetical protein
MASKLIMLAFCTKSLTNQNHLRLPNNAKTAATKKPNNPMLQHNHTQTAYMQRPVAGYGTSISANPPSHYYTAFPAVCLLIPPLTSSTCSAACPIAKLACVEAILLLHALTPAVIVCCCCCSAWATGGWAGPAA